MNRTLKVCGQCGALWTDGQRECSQCGFTQSVAKPDPFGSRPAVTQGPDQRLFIPPSERYALEKPVTVQVIDVRLSWGSAFDIAFKFAVVFLVGQLAIALLLYALFG